MFALIFVEMARPTPIASRRFGARSPRQYSGSASSCRRCATVWLTQSMLSGTHPGCPAGRCSAGRLAAESAVGACPPLPARCLRLAGIMIRPVATWSRMNSGVTPSRAATRRISGVITPFRAASSWVMPFSKAHHGPGRTEYRAVKAAALAYGSMRGAEVLETKGHAPAGLRCVHCIRATLASGQIAGAGGLAGCFTPSDAPSAPPASHPPAAPPRNPRTSAALPAAAGGEFAAPPCEFRLRRARWPAFR